MLSYCKCSELTLSVLTTALWWVRGKRRTIIVNLCAGSCWCAHKFEVGIAGVGNTVSDGVTVNIPPTIEWGIGDRAQSYRGKIDQRSKLH